MIMEGDVYKKLLTNLLDLKSGTAASVVEKQRPVFCILLIGLILII